MSLKKIAQMVGVSPSTVSRVLNNASSSCASSNLKEKIWEAARQLNYIPDANARNLKKGTRSAERTYQIAVVLARFSSLEADPFFGELFHSIEENLLAYSCLLHSISNADKINFSSLKEVDGIIILGRCSNDFLNSLKKYTRNIVAIDRNPTDYNVDEIICNGKTAAIKAMDYLLSLGHTKIGYIGDCSSETRYIGYCETLINRNIPINYNYIRSTNQTRESGEQAMNELFSQDIGAVFCANDISALGALDAISKAPANVIKKARKISVISIDNITLSQTSSPLLTTVNIPKEDMAHMAVSILLDRIKHGHNEYLRLEFPCKVIERESCYRI